VLGIAVNLFARKQLKLFFNESHLDTQLGIGIAELKFTFCADMVTKQVIGHTNSADIKGLLQKAAYGHWPYGRWPLALDLD